MVVEEGGYIFGGGVAAGFDEAASEGGDRVGVVLDDSDEDLGKVGFFGEGGGGVGREG